MKALVLLSTLTPAFLIFACSGADPQTGSASSDLSGNGSQAAQGGPPAPCPYPEPKLGSACPIPGQECTYGNCSDPGGESILECKDSEWTLMAQGSCGGGDGGAGVGEAGQSESGPACLANGSTNAHGTCSSDYGFFQSAEAACAKVKLDLSSFSPDEKCGPGSSSSDWYTCCPTPPQGCVHGGTVSKGCESDTTLFEQAEQTCAAQKLYITGFAADERCGPGSSGSATYTCCQ
jgi:hypothetical protein